MNMIIKIAGYFKNCSFQKELVSAVIKLFNTPTDQDLQTYLKCYQEKEASTLTNKTLDILDSAAIR